MSILNKCEIFKKMETYENDETGWEVWWKDERIMYQLTSCCIQIIMYNFNFTAIQINNM